VLPFTRKPYDPNMIPASAYVTPPSREGKEKTNTAIMDHLMKAACEAENGGNDLAGMYDQDDKYSPQLPAPQRNSHFMDEQTYVALAGHLTPRSSSRASHLVFRWLGGAKTSRQSEMMMPPAPAMPEQARMPPMPRVPPMSGGGNTIPGTMAGARLPPPKPASSRDTEITDTTNTSTRWYG
jgi:hypothetical protein